MAIVKWQQALFKLIAVCGLLSWDQGKKGLTKGSNESIKWVTHSRNQGKDIKVKEEDSKMS